MQFSTTALTFTLIGIASGIMTVVLVLYLLPLLVQRKRQYYKKKDYQKKVTEELVNNTRYRSPSMVAITQQIPYNKLPTTDYGSISHRDLESGSNNNNNNNNEVPSINITCDEDNVQYGSCNLQNNQSENFEESSRRSSDILEDPIQSSKRRFSSIVFSHSDELKILSESNGNLNIGDNKRERRASMSLFDTCKLACPDLTQELNHSTEHLNSLVLQDNNGSVQGKLYFSISQQNKHLEVNDPEEENHCDCKGYSLNLGLIKVTDIVEKKPKKQFLLEISIYSGSSGVEETQVYQAQTQYQNCAGEVVNFDENFNVELNQDLLHSELITDKSLVLVIELKHFDIKKNRTEKIGEIRFDLLGLIEGQILCVDGQEKFVVCRSFVSLSDKDRSIEDTGKIEIFLRFVKVSPMNLVIGIVNVKNIKSQKPYTSINVRVTLATEKKVLDSRKSKVIKLKNQNDDGVLKIDESFEFSLSTLKSLIGGRDSSSKLAKLSVEELFITVFLCGRNNIGFSHVLGKCVLGPIQYADGYGLLHWTKAIHKLEDIHYQWHTLKKV